METQYENVPSNVQDMPGRDEMLQSARARLNDTYEAVSARAKDAASYADESVRSNPWTSVGVGFGVGIVVGALLMLAARGTGNPISRAFE